MTEGTPIQTVASWPIAVSICQFIQICFAFRVKLTVFRSGKVTKAIGYFFSEGAGAEAARSEFHMSAAHFQFPSVCFSQTSRYFPRSSIGLPLASFIVNAYVPRTQAISPDLPTCTLVGCQLMTRPGLANMSFQTFRIASFVAALVAFGGSTIASSE